MTDLQILSEKYFKLVEELKDLQEREDNKKKEIRKVLYNIKLLQEKK